MKNPPLIQHLRTFALALSAKKNILHWEKEEGGRGGRGGRGEGGGRGGWGGRGEVGVWSCG